MNLLSLAMTNFRSFKGREVFEFPTQPGLYHMQGDNQVDSRLTGNGSGKSTIWEALVWLLDGKMSTGLKAGDVCNWDVDKGVEVSLTFAFDDDLQTAWYMTRTWKPNSWTLSHSSEHITDEEVIDLTKDPSNPVLGELRLKMPTFLQSIILAQEAPLFLDLKAENQTTMFSEVLDLEKWSELSRKASDKASQQDRSNRVLESDLARAEGAATQSVDYGAKMREWDEARGRRADVVEAEYEHELRTLNSGKKVVVTSLEERGKLRGLQEEVDLLVVSVREASKHSITCDRILAVANARANDLRLHLELAQKEDHCPSCGQPITESMGRQAKRQAKEAGEAVLEASSAVTKARDVLEQQDKWLVVKQQELREFDAALQEQEVLAKRIRREREDSERKLDKLEDELETILSEKNPWAQAQKDELGRARIAQDMVLSLRAALDRGNEQYSLYALWIKGFKEVRLQQIAEALTELEIEVNSSLVALGLPGWELLFSVDRETKGGSLQRGFSISVNSPHTERPVPWASWSGGEKQRLRLATSMGLSNLIRSRMGIKLALEVWDEPTKGLSQQGVMDLLKCLEARAQTEARVIWIVEHTSQVFGGFSGGVTVVKDQSGSHLKIEQPYI